MAPSDPIDRQPSPNPKVIGFGRRVGSMVGYGEVWGSVGGGVWKGMGKFGLLTFRSFRDCTQSLGQAAPYRLVFVVCLCFCGGVSVDRNLPVLSVKQPFCILVFGFAQGFASKWPSWGAAAPQTRRPQ